METTRRQLYIDGRWVQPSGTEMIEVENPATEEVIGRVPQADARDVDMAVRAAAAALDGWSQTPPAERAALCKAIGEALKARQEEVARVITEELGMPFRQSVRVQAGLPVITFTSMADFVEEVTATVKIGNSLIVREPVGVVAAITPWNYPLHQIALKVAAALTAGCTVVLKPSEVTPLNAFLFAEIVEGVGLPHGVLNILSGTGPVVGEALVNHPLVDMISFTGSTAVGRHIGEVAARHVTRVALELGGKSANVILEDADLEKAVPAGVAACYANAGQTCSALTRMLVPMDKLERATEIAAAAAATYTQGDPFAESTRLGPLVSGKQRERVLGYIRSGIEQGARLVTGGTDRPDGLDRGHFVRPTVFSNVRNDMKIAQEEIFGPVLSIIGYENEDHAVQLANDTIYGLSGGVWSSDPERAMRIARRLRTGQVSINGGAFNPLAPFGGFKQSGRGREGGPFGLEEFLEVKSIQQ